MQIARGLIEDTLRPPASLERARPTAYVEMAKASKQLGPDGKPLQPDTNADRILALQQRFGGIVGQAGNWYLYAKGAPAIRTAADVPTPQNVA